jgi:hypothetical protein
MSYFCYTVNTMLHLNWKNKRVKIPWTWTQRKMRKLKIKDLNERRWDNNQHNSSINLSCVLLSYSILYIK